MGVEQSLAHPYCYPKIIFLSCALGFFPESHSACTKLEGQLQQLFDFLPGIYFVVKNRDGRVIMANQVAVRLCGAHQD